MSYVLAIDVGTSFTAAALVKPHQGPTPAPEILALGMHGSAVPSVLFYADDGRVLVGEVAERRGLDDPRRMVREFKRRIGDSVPLSVGERWLAPEDVYATMARWVVDKAREREGSAPSSIIMTHPAAWGQHRTSLVLAALNMAGLQDITLISEPEAAALHYASQTRVEDGSIIAVYDLGGGTFDTAVLRKAGAGNFELLGRPDGIETLGGADFDAAVLRHVMAHLGDAPAMDPGSPETFAALSRLRRECREAKEALSLDSEASVAVSLPGTQLSVRLVRSEFEAMIEAPVRDTVDALERSLRSINLEAQDLSAVLLIGGSSRIPLVAELISVELDRPIAVDADPKSSICLGATVAGLRSQGAEAVDAAAASASAASASAASALAGSAVAGSAGASAPVATGRPHVPGRAPALSNLKTGPSTPGRHAPRPRVRMAAAAAVAATALTIATATAAQSPNGPGLLATMFGNQAADVMRDGGAEAGGAQASGAQGNIAGGAAGSTPVLGGPAGGLEASAKAGVTRAGSNGRAPAKQGANTGGANAGTGSAGTGTGNTAGSGSGAAAGTGAAGTTPPAAPGTSTTPGTQTPGTQTPGTQTPGTQTPGTQTPGTQTPPTTPAPDPTGGAASGPTPDPSTPPPTTPPVVEPTTPPVGQPTTPPVSEPTTPPTTPGDPVIPPPSPEPTVPAPEPTVVQDPPPPSPEPTLAPETTPPAVPEPAPIPSETSPTADPALLSAV
ncbi:Chaperone protein DnaK [Arthrobacter sp. 9V]|uniref:Hsp70 family protein n=1 Tax=Arthrobacter sp. 9V TaxID=2653132 RepID=UPI0012F40F1A|nr:Hsp70 family protein [Arthrobacter sp. 9V]VXC63385.1 Chaperone protein DnaK [Arthrobacter sp. 9V]